MNVLFFFKILIVECGLYILGEWKCLLVAAAVQNKLWCACVLW